MSYRRFKHAVIALGITLGVMCGGNAVGQSISELFPPPYPATSTPEALPLELGGTTPFPTVVPAPVADAPATEAVPGEGGATGELDLEVDLAEEPKWYYPTTWFQLPGWDTAVELGLNGSSGTSDSMSLRTGGYVKRKTKSRKIDFDIYHNRTQAGGIDTQNNAQASFRHDWLLADSPWSIYLQSQLYYDEFQDFDLNFSANSGVGYRFVDEEWMEATARMGSGTSREFGAPDDEWIPEAQFGLDVEQRFSETQKLAASIDYYPDWGNFGRYRLLTDIGYEVELAVPSNVSLKIAATNRFDSESGDADANNLNYSVLLLWKL